MKKHNLFNFIDENHNKKVLNNFLLYAFIISLFMILSAITINVVQFVKYNRIKNSLKPIESSIFALKNCKQNYSCASKLRYDEKDLPTNILQKILCVFPEEVVIAELNIKDDNVLLKGNSKDYQSINKLMHDLSGLGFKGLQANNIEHINGLDSELINFQLNFL